ncbi:MAG: hypothetical protein LUQ65_01395 [Candidatus Helarchaeota archaeon]|nr:hypothetical protein [Candidatus Helarchaeota archaeon]
MFRCSSDAVYRNEDGSEDLGEVLKRSRAKIAQLSVAQFTRRSVWRAETPGQLCLRLKKRR